MRWWEPWQNFCVIHDHNSHIIQTDRARRPDQQFRGEDAVPWWTSQSSSSRNQGCSPEDQGRSVVIVVVGISGHGKITEINIFISYLLGGEVDDPARTLTINNRRANQASSATQSVTCFRIRPLSRSSRKYAAHRWHARLRLLLGHRVRRIYLFVKIVSHVNTNTFICHANETRTTLCIPVSTSVLSLFIKVVHSCLRTVYTFTDAGSNLPMAP